MIDFREELQKYQPILEIDNIEVAIQTDEMQDVLDMVRYLAVQSGQGGDGSGAPPLNPQKKW